MAFNNVMKKMSFLSLLCLLITTSVYADNVPEEMGTCIEKQMDNPLWKNKTHTTVATLHEGETLSADQLLPPCGSNFLFKLEITRSIQCAKNSHSVDICVGQKYVGTGKNSQFEVIVGSIFVSDGVVHAQVAFVGDDKNFSSVNIDHLSSK